jgi:predicted HicB family RNase H-like nuclease
MARRRSAQKEVFNTRIRADVLRAAKALANLRGISYAELFEEALVDVLRKHGREDLVPKEEGRLF